MADLNWQVAIVGRRGNANVHFNCKKSTFKFLEIAFSRDSTFVYRPKKKKQYPSNTKRVSNTKHTQIWAQKKIIK